MDWRFLVTIIITVAIGIVAIVLAFRLAKKRKPVWAYKTTEIIGLDTDAPLGLKLTFNEQPVTNVYRTRVILFNKGNEAILKKHVTESIVIHFEGADVLQQPAVLGTSREGIRASAKQVVKEGDNAVELSFQYLDHNDGVVIEVLHNESRGIKRSGNVIGTSEIRYIGEFAPTLGQPLYSVITPVVSGIAVIGFSVGIFLKEGIQGAIQRGDIGGFIFLLVLGSALFGGGVAPFLRSRKFPRWSVITS